MPLTLQNIESELSYAYLHSVACAAGMSCKQGDRHDDGEGVDAEINYRGATTHEYITHVQLNIQLKTTIKPVGNYEEFFTYYLHGAKRYEKLRVKNSPIYKLLVVLFLPTEINDWLLCTEEQLILKNAAYWVNLYGADVCTNDSGVTVYLPKMNLLTPDELKKIVDLAANNNLPPYKIPANA